MEGSVLEPPASADPISSAAEDELRLRDPAWQRVLDRLPACAYVALATPRRTLRYLSPAVEQLAGGQRAAWLREPDPWRERIDPADRERVRAAVAEALERRTPLDVTYRLRTEQGVPRWVRDRAERVGDDGVLLGVLAEASLDERAHTMLPALERAWQQAERALLEERDRAQRYLDVAGTMIVVLDAEGRVELINRKGCAVLGYEERELVGRNWFSTVVPEADRTVLREAFGALLAGDGAGGEAFESVVLTKGGERRVIAWHNTLLRGEDGSVTATLSSGDDITDRRRAEQQIAYLAYHDDLTGLPNRTLLREHLELALARARRNGTQVALLFLDLDNFKLVNDSLGHHAGDQLLCRIAARLQRVTRATDLLVRQGGDEFLLLLADLDGDAEEIAALVARKVLDALADPFTIAGAEFQVGACIGISVSPRDAQDSEELLMHADAAMYQAKAQGSCRVTAYTAGGPDPLERLSMTTRLRRALDREEFRLHYQPIYRLGDGKLDGLEALIRWQDPEHGLIPPGAFVPVAEDTGLIEPIGEWVVGEIARQAAEWRSRGIDAAISFNVAPRQLRRPDFPAVVARHLAGHSLDPGRFTVEITESATALEADRILPVLDEIHRTGVRLAIDDFGAGYSSLGRLRAMPVQALKIDRSFLAGVPASREGVEIVTAIIQLADALGMGTVAEGVETEAQRLFLLEQGCPLAQGFLLSRPVPPEQAELLMVPR